MARQSFTIECVFQRSKGRWDDPAREAWTEKVPVVLEIELQQIARVLGWKALTNKTGKSRGMSGAIRAHCKPGRRI